jgi:hypothetical protein
MHMAAGKQKPKQPRPTQQVVRDLRVRPILAPPARVSRADPILAQPVRELDGLNLPQPVAEIQAAQGNRSGEAETHLLASYLARAEEPPIVSQPASQSPDDTPPEPMASLPWLLEETRS